VPQSNHYYNGRGEGAIPKRHYQQKVSKAHHNQRRPTETNNTNCSLCGRVVDVRLAVTLTKCRHVICSPCIVRHIKANDDTTIKCPLHRCNGEITDDELESILGNDFPAYAAKLYRRIKAEMEAIKVTQPAPLKIVKAPKPRQQAGLTKQDWELMKPFVFPQKPKIVDDDLNRNNEDFVCPECKSFLVVGKGVKLRKCFHTFCSPCLYQHIQNVEDVTVKCPHAGMCDKELTDVEIAKILGNDLQPFYLRIKHKFETDMKALKDQQKEEKLLAQAKANEELNLIPNSEPFDCGVCFETIEAGDGVMLHGCLHKFCKECLAGMIEHSDDCEIICPHVGTENCKNAIQDREIRALVTPQVLEKHLVKSLKLAEGTSENTYHCKTPDCTGWIIFEEGTRGFMCFVCKAVNCLGCKVIHAGKNCREYQDEVNPNAKHLRENAESELAIDLLVKNNEAMYCPMCSIPVMKVDGCDFMTCSTCKTGLCWVTKKPRKPITNRKGEFVDGCHCREADDAYRCHPQCNFCH